jgi:hypothetical protein
MTLIAAMSPGYFDETDRLKKIWRATLKRNADRPAIDLEGFDGALLKDPAVKESLRFFLEQLMFTEAAGAANLAFMASRTPNAQLRACYGAQIQDEVAHAQVLRDYLTRCLGQTSLREEGVSVLSRRLGMVAQRHPLIGVQAVTMGIEFYAGVILDAIVVALPEPALQATLRHILQDENRHKALTVEAVRVLESQGISQSPLGKLKRAAILKTSEAFFRHVLHPTIARRCAPLGVVWKDLYERSLDESRAAMARTDTAPQAVAA